MPSAGNLHPVEERRRGADRRSGVDRRLAEVVENAATLPLQRMFPHARLSATEAAARAAAIEAHRQELGSRLCRNVGEVVADVGYMLKCSGVLCYPTLQET